MRKNPGAAAPLPLRVSAVRLSAVLAPVILGTAALLLAACAAGPSLPPPAEIPFGEGRLWQVERPGSPPSYMFGTMHVSDAKVLDLPAAVETAFAKAEIAAFEVIEDADFSSELRASYMELPQGQRLPDLISAEDYRQLRGVLSAKLLSAGTFDGMQPWVVWSFIADREINVGRHDPTNRPILDDWLQQRAEEDGKRVVGLESLREHLDVFSGIPMDDQLSMLRSAMAAFYDPRMRVDRIGLYVDGDLAVIYALSQERLSYMEPPVARRYHARLITDRNRLMVERMLPLLEQGATFVAVGLLHMPGDDGVLRLLEQRGYTVTKLH